MNITMYLGRKSLGFVLLLWYCSNRTFFSDDVTFKLYSKKENGLVHVFLETVITIIVNLCPLSTILNPEKMGIH